ncbi:MAG: hypothetical protein BWK73_09340 [Thiothrix lacustris]|uniref:Uncharacterized protein n=1 Tax=Thiothrix lacustris TaxID=525917 RepID=A0A1Y1QW01_9GAMM|nr:MAG: hypothetical protein BWK73_09340 [Thiothrix lacustris]
MQTAQKIPFRRKSAATLPAKRPRNTIVLTFKKGMSMSSDQTDPNAASERMNLRLTAEERTLISDMAAKAQMSEKEVVIKGMRLLAAQMGYKPAKQKRETRAKFFAKNEAQQLLAELLAASPTPMPTHEIIDAVILKKGGLTTDQAAKLKRSFSVILHQTESKGLIAKADKVKGVAHWKAAKKPLTDAEGEVRELTAADIATFEPLADVLPDLKPHVD